ncbi:hypothetical protein FIBSPDRAFT_853309 [Athelia psychrophila]|uniref:Uncharacterized protein n=1 Tax=Athelia psychrophila TaxID=1759441 RepID=A0A166R0C1_9AGAM|nr:hypothetical protein FIBSPDRAFT_853309 [Fibularhizoctonia sp. CBS 109695]
MHNGHATNGCIGHSGCPDPLLTIPTSIFTHHPAQPHQHHPAPHSLRRNHTRVCVAQRRAGPPPQHVVSIHKCILDDLHTIQLEALKRYIWEL